MSSSFIYKARSRFEQIKAASTSDSIHSNQLMALFLAGFAVIYILASALMYQSIFPDSAQNIAWGHTVAWSYNCHPPLGTWLLGFMKLLLGNNEIAVFSSSVLCLSISLFFIYQLSKRYLTTTNSLFACILTSFILYYQINFVLQYNQNTIMLPCWVMACYYFDCCLRSNRMQDWILLALVTTASLLAKYESLLIILLLLLYLVFHFDYKYKTKLLIAFVVSSVLLVPHLLSVAQNGFLSLEYLHSRISEGQTNSKLYVHLFYPLTTLFEQLSHLLPAVFLLFFLIKAGQVNNPQENHSVSRFNYLVYLGVAPLVLLTFISLVFGMKIQAEWGFPIFSFTLPALFSYFRLDGRSSFLKMLVWIALSMHLGILMVYTSVNFLMSKPTRANNPSYDLAKSATNYWHQFSQKPIHFVGGDEYIDFYLAAYLPGRPLILEDYSFHKSPWLTKEQLQEQGIFFVMKGCDAVKNERLKKQFLAREYRCVEIPLSNKYNDQLGQYTFMVVPPQT